MKRRGRVEARGRVDAKGAGLKRMGTIIERERFVTPHSKRLADSKRRAGSREAEARARFATVGEVSGCV